MSERFFVDHPITGDQAELLGPEVHHLAHVLRAKVGDLVTIFDGLSDEYAARIRKIERSRVVLDVLERSAVNRELPFELILGVSLPRGDRQKWLAEKLTELGVTRLVPLCAARTVAEPGSAARERLHRASIEAAKQCGRNRLLEIAAPLDLGDFLRAAPPTDLRVLAHPRSPAPAERQSVDASTPTSTVWGAVGPEGGFSDDELELGQQCGWQWIELGPRILRIETAAVALAVIAAWSWRRR